MSIGSTLKDLIALGVPLSSPVSVSGLRAQGQTLTAKLATGWTSTGWQWVSTDLGGTSTDISGATNSTYTLQASDAGKFISIRAVGLSYSSLKSPVSGPAFPGNVASRILVPNGKIPIAEAAYGNFASIDFAGDDINPGDSLIVRLPNWFYSATTESGPGSTTQFQVSLEYPLGSTPARFTFATNTGDPFQSITSNNTDVETVALVYAGTAIPKGAAFKWHVFAFSLGGGIPINQTSAYLPDDRLELSTSPLTPRTSTGGVYGIPSTGRKLAPTLLRKLTIRASVAGQGDSNTLGTPNLVTTSFPASDDYGMQGLTARSVAPNLSFMNLGSYGDTAAAFITASGTKRCSLMGYASHLIFADGINDIVINNRTGAQVYADQVTKKGLFPGVKIGICTLAPCTTGAWSNPDGSDQVLRAQEAERLAYNTLVRANSGAFDKVFDTAPVVTQGASKWIAPNYTIDGTHYNIPAQLAVKNSGIINTSDNFFIR